MGAELPPGGLPPTPGATGEPTPAGGATGEPVRNESPARRALAMNIGDSEQAAAAKLLEEAPPLSHADLREMLRRNVEALRAMLEKFPSDG
ncbi:MAG: hypothetical protein ACAI38_12250 [Myxococcota bacterium]